MNKLFTIITLLLSFNSFTQSEERFFDDILLATDSIRVDIFVHYTNEMAVDKNHIIRKKIDSKGLSSQQTNKFVRVINNPQAVLNYYANYSHQNIEFYLYEKGNNVGKIIVSSVSGNIIFDDLKGKTETKMLAQTTGQYMIRILKSTDLLQYFYPSNLVGFSRGTEKEIQF